VPGLELQAALLDHPPHAVGHAGGVVLGLQVHDLHAPQFVAAVARQAAVGVVDLEDAAVKVAEDHPVDGGVHQRAVALLALGQRPLGLALLAGVAHEADVDLAVGQLGLADGQVQVHPVAVAMQPSTSRPRPMMRGSPVWA
jgi:hypothetical protein